MTAEQEREAVVRWLRDDAKAADEQAKRFAERGKYQHALEMQHHAETQRLNAVTIARGEHIKETSE